MCILNMEPPSKCTENYFANCLSTSNYRHIECSAKFSDENVIFTRKSNLTNWKEHLSIDCISFEGMLTNTLFLSPLRKLHASNGPVCR